MSNEAIIKDLGSHLQQRIGEVLVQQLKVAQRVLPGHEVALLFMEAAVSVSMSAAASFAASIDDEARAAEQYDWIIAQIARAASGERDRALAEAAKLRAAA